MGKLSSAKVDDRIVMHFQNLLQSSACSVLVELFNKKEHHKILVIKD